jgi:predicted glycoside hydrolase/deacetylase ChbG (UPF0249 family)
VKSLTGLLFGFAAILPVGVALPPVAVGAPAEAIQLLVRADDLGVAQAINAACVEAYRNGIARSVEVIVPGAWFLDAVQLLRQHPELDVGVHLCLTSEWDRCKWRPLTAAPSLVDANGYFRPMVRQRPDFPPDTGFLDALPALAEVEAELRAQIELAKRHLPRVSHLSAHMGAATATPELRALTARLAAEYGLALETAGLQPVAWRSANTPAERERTLIELLEHLAPGRWLLVEHPAFDTPETRAFGHQGYEDVAAHRAAVTHAFTSDRVRAVIQQRGIQLISYADLQPQPGRH